MMDHIKTVLLNNFKVQEKQIKVQLRSARMELDYSAHESTQRSIHQKIYALQSNLEFVSNEIATLTQELKS